MTLIRDRESPRTIANAIRLEISSHRFALQFQGHIRVPPKPRSFTSSKWNGTADCELLISDHPSWWSCSVHLLPESAKRDPGRIARADREIPGWITHSLRMRPSGVATCTDQNLCSFIRSTMAVESTLRRMPKCRPVFIDDRSDRRRVVTFTQVAMRCIRASKVFSVSHICDPKLTGCPTTETPRIESRFR
jgi:hypothetical protein